MLFADRSARSNDRLSYWGGPMASDFSERERRVAQLAAKRWGLCDPAPCDVLERAYGPRWMEDHPGLASLVTSYAIGVEDQP